jgi:hypothetical protein
MRLRTRLLIVSLALSFLPAALVAAELQEQTRRAFDRYAEDATAAFLKRVRAGSAASSSGGASNGSLLDGETAARAGGQDGIIGVPDGLVHHWFGTTFIDNVTLDDVLAVSYAYNDYHAYYRPVIASRLLSRDGDTFRARLRIRESAGGLTAVLDVTTRVQYFRPEPGSAYSISTSDEIRQVEDPGSPRERQLPAGRDSGYLWRAVTLSRLIQRDSGVVVEMETLGLSREFPPLLGWIIEPIARRIGRKSVELSLQEFRAAVRNRTSRGAAR